jgi:hypothetical protein
MKLQINPAMQGVQWVKLGIGTFFKQPLALSGLFFMAFVALIVVGALPVVGGALSLMLVPALAVGIFLASEQASNSMFPKPSALVSALRQGKQQTKSILIIGTVYFCSFWAVLGLSALIDDGALVKLLWDGAKVSELPSILENARLQYALLLFIGLNAPLLLIFSNASALVHRHQLTPGKSIFFSAVTVVKNYRALAVFAAAWIGVSVAISFAISLLTVIAGNSKELFVTLVFSSSLLWYAMIVTSMYFTFRDCFEATLGEPQ